MSRSSQQANLSPANLGSGVSTGYLNMRDVNAELFGSEVISQTDEVYGLDEEGELRGSYRPSGHPGVSGQFLAAMLSVTDILSQLWFASGAFAICRTMSKPLVSHACSCSPRIRAEMGVI